MNLFLCVIIVYNIFWLKAMKDIYWVNSFQVFFNNTKGMLKFKKSIISYRNQLYIIKKISLSWVEENILKNS